MNRNILPLWIAIALVPLAGCFGGDGGSDYVPGEFQETGNTVHIRMWVEDMVQADIYPGFKANLWAFCAEPANPDDQYSRDAIEYREPTGIVQRLQSDNSYLLDEDATSKCSVPGPQLRVQQGDTVIVDFENKHFHPHTIHWHGQFVPWESDGVPGSTQDSVAPPGQFRYEFVAKREGTLWYHCHVDTQFHVMQGLYGVIIVEPQDTSQEPEDIDDEYSLVFSNLIRDQVEYIPPAPGEFFDPHADHKAGGGHACGVSSGFQGCQNPPVDPEPDVFMINGVSAPNTFQRDDTLMVVEPDDRIRIRMLNAGPFTVETIHLHGHDMLVTHRDGVPLPDPFWVDTITIGPGERYDVVVEAEAGREGIWVMHTHITSHVTNDQQYPGGMLTKLVYQSILDEYGTTQPFLGVELPGGQPARRAVDIPDDFPDRELLDLPDQDSGELATWSFPVEAACAVRGIHIDGDIVPDTAVTGALAAITAELVGPDGTTHFTASLGGQDPMGFVWDINETTDGLKVADMFDGDYTIRLAGQSLGNTADLSVFVDYYRTMDEADLNAEFITDAAAGDVQRPLCGEILEDGTTAYQLPAT